MWRGPHGGGCGLIGFGLLLGCYLLGLSLGAKWVSQRSGALNPIQLFIRLQVGIGWALLAALPCALWSVSSSAIPAQLATPFVLLGVTTLFGAAFPIAGTLSITRISVLGSQLSLVYAANLAGAVLGSVLTGFVLIPSMGTQQLLFLLPLLHFLVAGAIAAPRRIAWPQRMWLAAAGVGVVAAVALQQGAWMEQYVLRASPVTQQPDGRAEFRIVALEETDIQALAVLESKRGERLLLGGSHISGTTLRRHTQTVQSHLGMLMHPRPSRVLEIGYGVGELLKTILDYQPGQVDLVELDPRMTAIANEHFADLNYRASERDNVTLHIMDGRRFLQRTQQQYDLVMNDTMFLGSEQSLRLYTEEHFRRGYQALTPDGVLLAWLPLNMQDEAIQTVTRTFLAVFERAYLWNPDSYPEEAFLVGMKGTALIDYAALTERFEHVTRAGAVPGSWTEPLHFLSGFRADTEQLRQFAGPGPIHRDMTPTVDFAIGGEPELSRRLVQRSARFITDHLKVDAHTRAALEEQLASYSTLLDATPGLHPRNHALPSSLPHSADLSFGRK